MTLSSTTNRAPDPDRVEIQGGISWSYDAQLYGQPMGSAPKKPNAQAMMGEVSMSNPLKDQ